MQLFSARPRPDVLIIFVIIIPILNPLIIINIWLILILSNKCLAVAVNDQDNPQLDPPLTPCHFHQYFDIIIIIINIIIIRITIIILVIISSHTLLPFSINNFVINFIFITIEGLFVGGRE